MAEAQSLKLLKGGAKAAALSKAMEEEPVKTAKPKAAAKPVAKPVVKSKPVQQEAPEPEPVEETPAEQSEYDQIMAMNAKQLDGLLTDNEVAFPDGWNKLKLDAKKEWVLSQFEIENAAEAVATEEPEEEAAEEPETEEAEEAEEVEEAKPAKAAKAKAEKKAKGKAVATSDVKHGEILDKEHPLALAADIETMDEEQTKQVIAALSEQADSTYFRLGGAIKRVAVEKWYKPYSTLREFVETEYNISYRTAAHWMKIYTDIVDAEISAEKLSGIGWSKLKELSPILTNENIDAWLKKIKGKTVSQIKMLVDQSLKEAGGGDDVQPSENTVASVTKTKTFKLHVDQQENVEAALDKAKKEGSTDVDSVALEYICIQYLNMTGKKGKPVLNDAMVKDYLVKKGTEDAANLVAEAFPDNEVTLSV